ncbi:hypothetical protein C8R47DRAFT_1139476 [Mycena vitilis]|nr:hypothetical protein C8R47DRAFT_1139476 [Mycena vitilis]
MPLARLSGDAALELLEFLPLSAIAPLALVQKAWKEFLDINESNIYHSAAVFHRFIPSTSTSLQDATAALEFSTDGLDINGWKKYCQVQIAVERNWAGVGPSTMEKLDDLGEHVYQHTIVFDRGHSIVASSNGAIYVFAAGRQFPVWGLTSDYLQGPARFAYDNGYLVFLNPTPMGAIDIWHEASNREFHSKPSVPQRVAAESSKSFYGDPDVGHFVPCFTLPHPADDEASFLPKLVRFIYPILIAATPTKMHMWDISTGAYIRALSVRKELDGHGIRGLTGLEMSQDFVVGFDAQQLRVFSRHDGNFLYHFSKKTPTSPPEPPAVQLSPARDGVTSAQWHGAVLLQQVLFPKRCKWTCPRGEFCQIGISPCGTTLVVVADNNRILIIHEFKRMLREVLPLGDVAVEVKIAKEYGDPRGMRAAVTRNRIAIGTFRGTIVLTLDRSKGGLVPPGSVRVGRPSSSVAPVQIAASFLNLNWQSRDSNLAIVGTKLFFEAEPAMTLNTVFNRGSGRSTAHSNAPAPVAALAQDDSDNDPLYDDLPELQSVSNSSDDVEDADEESDHGAPDDIAEDSRPDAILSKSKRRAPPSEEDEDGVPDSDDDSDSDDGAPIPAGQNQGGPPYLIGLPMQPPNLLNGNVVGVIPWAQPAQGPLLSCAFFVDMAPKVREFGCVE